MEPPICYSKVKQEHFVFNLTQGTFTEWLKLLLQHSSCAAVYMAVASLIFECPWLLLYFAKKARCFQILSTVSYSEKSSQHRIMWQEPGLLHRSRLFGWWVWFSFTLPYVGWGHLPYHKADLIWACNIFHWPLIQSHQKLHFSIVAGNPTFWMGLKLSF